MNGTPVWLASLSRTSSIKRGPIPTGLWSPSTRDESVALLRRMLGPAGNVNRERLFRMNVTLCLHRAIMPSELDALPPYFFEDGATDLAGGPVEILWENEQGLLSTKPCHHPRHGDFGYGNPLLWLPLDCGVCPPCVARRLLDDEQDAKTERAASMLSALAG